MAQVRFKSFSNRSSLDKTRPCSGGNLYLSHRLERISIGLSPLGSRYENRADLDCEQHVRIQHRMGVIMATGMLMAIPPIIFTVFASRQIITGMTAGAVKE